MALLHNELKIIPLQELLLMELAIPVYQRPYNWSLKAANTLFLDTYKAFQDGTEEYRIGTVILHKDEKKYNIVDGQQRLTTLSILLFCLGNKNQKLLQETYNTHSNDAIVANYRILSKRIKEFSKDECDQYRQYILGKCTTVQVVTDSEQEAFQFFDSQNSRGKELSPHDLLKSYHLREMNNQNESDKVKIIEKWENLDQNQLNNLFKDSLYPLLQWYKGKNGLGFSSGKIEVFKGLKSANTSNYAIYHKASNLFVEQFNTTGSCELLATGFLNQFQLTQPLIAGKRFFNYTLHYSKLLDEIRSIIGKAPVNEVLSVRGQGDLYIKQLYECVLLFFADRFGIQSVNESVRKHLYSWSYSLRLTMSAVYQETINKYARGKHERLNENLKLFTEISEMNTPDELKLIVLECPDVRFGNEEKYEEIYELLRKWNGW